MSPRDIALLAVAFAIVGYLIFHVGLSMGVSIGRKRERLDALKRERDCAWMDHTATNIIRMQQRAQERRAEQRRMLEAVEETTAMGEKIRGDLRALVASQDWL